MPAQEADDALAIAVGILREEVLMVRAGDDPQLLRGLGGREEGARLGERRMSVQLPRHHQNRRAEAGDAVDRAEILGSGAEPGAQLCDQEWSEDRREWAGAEAAAVLKRDPDVGVDRLDDDRVDANRLRPQQHRRAAE